MATYTDSLGFNKGAAVRGANALNKTSVVSITLDFAAIAAARVAAGAAALAATDVLQVMQIPAKSMVLSVGVDVTTAEAAVATMSVGDGTTATGYITNADLNVVGSQAMVLTLIEAAPNLISGYSSGKYYAAADTIDVVINTAATDKAVCTVWAVVADCS